MTLRVNLVWWSIWGGAKFPPTFSHFSGGEKLKTACVAANNQIQGSKTTPIYDSLPSTISTASGKVRDAFTTNDATSPLVLVTTDRQSAFDRHLTSIPYKGAVLNLISAYWFDQTKDILPNHIISTPHPNITCAKKAEPFPIEFVVRAYLTGSTETSIWKHYSSGARSYCGHPLPDGLLKNTKLANGPIMTPTTKVSECAKWLQTKGYIHSLELTHPNRLARFARPSFKNAHNLARRRV